MTPDRRPEGMGIIVKTVARWLKGFILLYGIYLVLYGHLTPGGGFAGGVVIACAFILLTMTTPPAKPPPCVRCPYSTR